MRHPDSGEGRRRNSMGAAAAAGAGAAILLLASCGYLKREGGETGEAGAKPAPTTALSETRQEADRPHADFSMIFQEGRRLQTRSGEALIRLHAAGDLALPTGKLVACDPLSYPNTEPFKDAFPRGSYPVVLSVAVLGPNEWVAAARVVLAEGAPVRWENAKTSSAPAEPPEGGYFGFPVESGLAGFLDASAANELRSRMKQSADTYEKNLMDRLTTTGAPWSWGNLAILPAAGQTAGANLVVFTSGYGDGLYGTWIGYDESGAPVAVVTDFGIL